MKPFFGKQKPNVYVVKPSSFLKMVLDTLVFVPLYETFFTEKSHQKLGEIGFTIKPVTLHPPLKYYLHFSKVTEKGDFHCFYLYNRCT